MHNVSILFDETSNPPNTEDKNELQGPATSLPTAIKAFDFCVVDLETTGMNPFRGAEIIEIGAVRIENGTIGDTFQQLVQPRRSIPPHITDLTGITNRMVSGKPSIHTVMPEFVRFLDDAIMLAHNFSFDFSFLDYYASDDFYNDHICTVKLARTVADFPSNALDFLNEHLSLQREEAHRALDDAQATAKLFLHLSKQVTHPEDYHRAGLPACLHQIHPGALVMNLQGIGRKKARNVSRKFHHTTDLLSASEEDLLEVPGIGPSLSDKIESLISSFEPISPGRNAPVRLDTERDRHYDRHHRDQEPPPDAFIRQT